MDAKTAPQGGTIAREFTGKTVVALHRAVRLARANPSARILLTTYSEPLAELLQSKLKVLAPETGAIIPRITVRDLPGTAEELFQLVCGRRPRFVSADALRSLITNAAEKAGIKGFTLRFLLSEWTNVIDAWGIDRLDRYATVPRLGTEQLVAQIADLVLDLPLLPARQVHANHPPSPSQPTPA